MSASNLSEREVEWRKANFHWIWRGDFACQWYSTLNEGTLSLIQECGKLCPNLSPPDCFRVLLHRCLKWTLIMFCLALLKAVFMITFSVLQFFFFLKNTLRITPEELVFSRRCYCAFSMLPFLSFTLLAVLCQLFIFVLVLVSMNLISPHVECCSVLNEVQMWHNWYLLIL